MDGWCLRWCCLFSCWFFLISAIFIRYRWYSFIKLHGASLCSVCSAFSYCAYACLLKLNWELWWLWLDCSKSSFSFFSEYRRVAFSLYCCCILHRFSDRLFSELVEIFAYWAPSSGESWNYFRGFDLMGLLHYVWLKWYCFFWCFFLISAFSSGMDDLAL